MHHEHLNSSGTLTSTPHMSSAAAFLSRLHCLRLFSNVFTPACMRRAMTRWLSSRIIKLPMLYREAKTARTFHLRHLWHNIIFTETSVACDGHINDDGDRNWTLLTGGSPAAFRRWTSALMSNSVASEQTTYR
jgi:hypothetical protein